MRCSGFMNHEENIQKSKLIMSINRIILAGRLGQDPTIRQAGETKVCNVSLATSEKRKNKEEVTEWHNLVFWGPAAEVMQKYAQKGTLMYVEGRQQSRTYTGSDGIKKHTTENVVSSFEFLAGYKKPHTGGRDFRDDEPVETSYDFSKNGDFN